MSTELEVEVELYGQFKNFKRMQQIEHIMKSIEVFMGLSSVAALIQLRRDSKIFKAIWRSKDESNKFYFIF